METKDCIVSRRSIRKFTEQKVDHAVLEEVVRLASYSPSWKNTQVVRYHAVEDEAMRTTLAEECMLGFEGNGKITKNCPVLVVVSYKHGISGYERSGEPTTSKGDKWEVFDAGIATQTFALAAHEVGLGTVIMGIFDEEKVAQTVGLPENEVAAALLAVGYPAIDPQAPPRKDVETLLTWK